MSLSITVTAEGLDSTDWLSLVALVIIGKSSEKSSKASKVLGIRMLVNKTVFNFENT
jgi:hypothetical protein